MDWVWLFTKFDGRINRAKLWLVLVLTMCAGLAVGVPLAVLAAATSSGAHLQMQFSITDMFTLVDPVAMQKAWAALASYDLTSPGTLLPLLYRLIFSPLAAWCFLAASVKRLHDRDRSGWWIVPFYVVPALFNHFEDRLDDSYPMFALSVVMCGLWLWGMIELFFLKGTPANNRFGPNPLPAARAPHGAPAVA